MRPPRSSRPLWRSRKRRGGPGETAPRSDAERSPSGDDGGVPRRKLCQHRSTQKMLHRVVPEKCGEQRRHRRKVGHPGGGADRHALGHEAVVHDGRAATRTARRSSSVKKIPMERTWAEFWKVEFIPEPAPRCWGGRLFITPARLGEPNEPIVSPMTAEDRPEDPVREVDREKLERQERCRGADHARPWRKAGRRNGPRGCPTMGPAIRKPAVSGSM